jgi:peptidoglycan/xylan/chitin deacetylase (PgdA/CDA1 family)
MIPDIIIGADTGMTVPFGERGGRLRGGLDLVAGRYPRFVFGGGIGNLLPVFHFHDEERDDFRRKLQYLADNRYRTVVADDIAAFVAGAPLPDRSVALCFDDAWSSVWTMAGVALKEYGFRAILYAIPGRTEEATACRERGVAAAGSPFATWPELRALQAEGSFDIQSHTFSHAMISTAATPTDFVRPEFAASSYLGRPMLDEHPRRPVDESVRQNPPRFTTPADLGAPLYPTRSRMSEAPRVWHAPDVRAACMQVVRDEGGAAFFARTDWRSRLESVVASTTADTHVESADEQQRRIEDELGSARDVLRERLGRPVDHVCLPWGVSGRQTERALKRLGIVTAVANRMPGMFAVRPGDDPLWLKRLPNRYIYRLPGEGRRWWFVARR